MPGPEHLLDPRTLARIDNYNLLARHVVEGFIAGLQRGLYHGFGSEFVQYRNYNRGDDLKYVDWKVYARLGRLLTKVFQEETNCHCYLVVDTSASMGYAGAGRVTKLHYAKMLAACLAYLVNRQGDNVGLFAYADRLHREVKPGHRSGHVQRLLAALAGLQPGGTGDHQRVLTYLGEKFNRRGIIVMLSDFLEADTGLVRALKHFRAAHHEVILFHLLDDDELDLDLPGTVRFVDSESGAEVITAPTAVQPRYRAAVAEYLQTFRAECRRHEIDHELVRTSQALDGMLAAYLHRRESLR